MITNDDLNSYMDYFLLLLSVFGNNAFIDSPNRFNMSAWDIKEWAKDNAFPVNPLKWNDEQKMLCRLTWL